MNTIKILLLTLVCSLITLSGQAQTKPKITGEGILNDIHYISPQAFLFYRSDLKKELQEVYASGGITNKEFQVYSICLRLKEYIAVESYTECASYAHRKLKDDTLPLWLKKMLAQCLTTAYFKMGMLDKGQQAQEYYYQLIEESEKISGQPYTEYMLSAEFYFDAKEYETAASKYKESLRDHLKHVKTPNKHFLGFLCNNIALCYLEVKEYDSVVKYNDLARSYWNAVDDKNTNHFNALLDANLAMIYMAKGREDEAVPLLYHYMKGCEYIDYYHYVKSFVDLANVYVQMHKYDRAQAILDSLDKEVKLPVIDSKILLQKYFTHYRIMNRKGEHERAEDFLNQYLLLSEEKYNENKRKELKQYALLYDIYEKQKELEFSKIELLENEQIRDGQRITLWIVIAVTTLIVALSIILFVRYKFQQKIVALTQERKEVAEKALVSRETMLREVHHRIKNNLNTMNGLFHLQLKSANNEELREQLQKSANRVFSIAEIHNMLYNESFLENVDIREYLQSLCNHLLRTSNSEIQLNLEVENISLNMDYALPLGLVVNELFTNSVKHAFKDVEQGVINIKFYEEDGEYFLTYSDNGPGYDLNQETNSLGLKLIKMMQKQLNAVIQHLNGNQFSFHFTVNA
ncbi:Two-component sensor histidine kinase, contains HisKA and HATPase domains [Lishizhenia tianjinensis]|uniref:histidine kinase n=1 Tax=Lishizhenia tianjinensis TaxID=477690 RepID=A0A1I6ZX64_9FLAO|nr:sensor histidine kinase [Lishizhenia tianjinensis]SFT67278.1 Two-component sensor histidine kinase, contains HisKA and HATPase domains [Lishizhenia tianjinensis]